MHAGTSDRNASSESVKHRSSASSRRLMNGHGSESEGMDDMLEVVVRSASKASDPKNAQRIKTSERKSCEFR